MAMRRDFLKHLVFAMGANLAYGKSVPFHDDVVLNPGEAMLNDKPAVKVIPKGCREFKLDSGGDETKYVDQTVFTCIAINLKSAQKKFKAWDSLNK